MTCRELTASIGDFIDGELLAEDRRQLQQHLARCQRCTRYLAHYRQTIAFAKRSFRDEEPMDVGIPEDLLRAILQARIQAP